MGGEPFEPITLGTSLLSPTSQVHTVSSWQFEDLPTSDSAPLVVTHRLQGSKDVPHRFSFPLSNPIP